MFVCACVCMCVCVCVQNWTDEVTLVQLLVIASCDTQDTCCSASGPVLSSSFHPLHRRSESDIESKFIQSDIHDVVNPLTWNKLPEIVRKSLPKWKDDLFSQSEQLRLRTAAQSSTSASSPTTPQGGTHSPKCEHDNAVVLSSSFTCTAAVP